MADGCNPTSRISCRAELAEALSRHHTTPCMRALLLQAHSGDIWLRFTWAPDPHMTCMCMQTHTLLQLPSVSHTPSPSSFHRNWQLCYTAKPHGWYSCKKQTENFHLYYSTTRMWANAAVPGNTKHHNSPAGPHVVCATDSLRHAYLFPVSGIYCMYMLAYYIYQHKATPLELQGHHPKLTRYRF